MRVRARLQCFNTNEAVARTVQANLPNGLSDHHAEDHVEGEPASCKGIRTARCTMNL